MRLHTEHALHNQKRQKNKRSYRISWPVESNLIHSKGMMHEQPLGTPPPLDWSFSFRCRTWLVDIYVFLFFLIKCDKRTPVFINATRRVFEWHSSAEINKLYGSFFHRIVKIKKKLEHSFHIWQKESSDNYKDNNKEWSIVSVCFFFFKDWKKNTY